MKRVRARRRGAGQGGTAARAFVVLAAVILVAGVSVIEMWPDPPGWLRPERRVDLRILHWLDIHWLNAAAIAAIAGFAAALVPLLIWLHDRRRTERPPSQRARERDIMLRRVRRKWITGVLEPSLAHTAMLILGLQTQPDVLHTPKGPAQSRGSRQVPVPEQKSILDVFEEAEGSLVIIGARGAGKTTLLLQLASALIDRAEREPSKAVPIVVNLESWASHRLALDQWLLAELTGSYYKVPPETAADWIETGELILLLDGLDEVEQKYRRNCVEAINNYQRTHGLNSLVVCSRMMSLQSGRRHGRPSPGAIAAMIVMFTRSLGLLFTTITTAIGMGITTGLLKGPVAGLIVSIRKCCDGDCEGSRGRRPRHAGRGA